MNKVRLLGPGSAPVHHEGGLRFTGPLGPLVFAEAPAQPTFCSVSQGDRRVKTTSNRLDDAIAHIYRAGILIKRRCAGAGSTLVDEAYEVTHELEAAIRQIQGAAFESRDTFTPHGLRPYPVIWAWSEQECRWLGMSFAENRAWLARPDFDPVEFASHDVKP
jgi:hypothetical protein